MKKGKKIENMAIIICMVAIVWLLMSWIDCISHNLTDRQYQAWNLLMILWKVFA